MAKKSSSGISISTIVFLVVMYNVIFDDDDDKKDVEVKTDGKEIISVDEIKVKTKEIFIKTTDGAIKKLDEYLSSGEKKPEVEVIISEEKPKEDPPEEVLVAEPEVKEETLKPLDTNSDKPEDDMQKL